MFEPLDELVVQRWLEIARIYFALRAAAAGDVPAEASHAFGPAPRTSPANRWL